LSNFEKLKNSGTSFITLNISNEKLFCLFNKEILTIFGILIKESFGNFRGTEGASYFLTDKQENRKQREVVIQNNTRAKAVAEI